MLPSFYLVLLGFVGFEWVLLGLNRFFTGFFFGLHGFYWVLMGLNPFK